MIIISPLLKSQRTLFSFFFSFVGFSIMWESENESVRRREYGNGLLSPSKHGFKTDGFELKDQSWHVSTDISSDLLVQVDDVNFYLHKYLLFSRSGKMARIVYEARDADLSKIVMNDLPGGHEAFLLAAKFCYGIAVDLTSANISGLRCAAEYLEMTEDYEEGNLIFKTEAFLSYVVLSSWSDSIIVLKNCEQLSPWAENLQIVRRCSDCIAWKACANPNAVRWAYTVKPENILGTKRDEVKDPSHGKNLNVPPDWWFEDVSILRIDHFVRVVTAIKVKGMSFELIGASIVYYASKWLPGLINYGNKSGTETPNCRNGNASSSSYDWNGGLHLVVVNPKDEISTFQAKERRMIIESLISILPPQKDSVSCSFLLQLLRMAIVLKVAPALITELEKRVGMQFEQATLPDLIIPSFNTTETIYDVDLVQRLLDYFLIQELTESSSPSAQCSSDKNISEGSRRSGGSSQNAKIRVARLVDSYLTEVAKDRNLSLTKFQVLAEALPGSSRSCDDGLYRAVDSYLKAHPTLSEHERKRLCRVMDCRKLSVDACTHAVQNERLPLRVVVQVLFCEQMKINNVLTNNSFKEAGESHIASSRKTLLEGTPQSFQDGWTTAKKDINTLKFELDTVKANYRELQANLENLQGQFEKILKQKRTSSWSSGWKKLSKLTKMNAILENEELTSQVSTTEEKSRKAQRRWRNSIS